jgi:hypothetical protein
LDDALRADVDPAAGGHLPYIISPARSSWLKVPSSAHFWRRGSKLAIRARAEASACVREDADRACRQDEQGLVVLEPLERLDDGVEASPIARRAADAAVDDEALRVFGDLLIEIVHQHPHSRFGGPAFGDDLRPRRARMRRLLSRRLGHQIVLLRPRRASAESMATRAIPATTKPSAIASELPMVRASPRVSTAMNG